MINEKHASNNAASWPIDILEAMDKLWEFGVRPNQYTRLWIEQADHQDLDYDMDDLEDY